MEQHRGHTLRLGSGHYESGGSRINTCLGLDTIPDFTQGVNSRFQRRESKLMLAGDDVNQGFELQNRHHPNGAGGASGGGVGRGAIRDCQVLKALSSVCRNRGACWAGMNTREETEAVG